MSSSARDDDPANQNTSLVSVIIPALDEVDNVPGLLGRFREFGVSHPSYDFELVLIDDGSTDGTSDLVRSLTRDDDRITVIRLARSFGSHYAISAGLARCSGDCAVVFGADLQEPPSLLADFLAKWEQGADVVWGVPQARVGRSASRDLASKAFSALFSKFANLANYPPEGPSGVLLDRCVIDEVARLPERNRNVLALIAWLGFTQVRVDYQQVDRMHGTSRWTRRKMFKLAVDSLIQFSSMPLRLCTAMGAAIAAVGMLYASILVIRALLGVDTPSGWPTVLVIVLVLGGAQLAVIGVIGEYLWRAVEETRSRPLYVVRDVWGSVPASSTALGGLPRHGRRPTSSSQPAASSSQPATPPPVPTPGGLVPTPSYPTLEK
jgi:polyisoprenyl-phosphate glycosyltransferase